MEIIQLEKKHAKIYHSLRLEALKNHPSYFAASYEEEGNASFKKYEERFKNPKNSYTFGAFMDGDLVGIITLIRMPMEKLNHRTSIVAMYTKKEKQGMGIGRALMKRAIEKAKNLKGVEQIHLTLVTTNLAAKKLYSSFGFEVIGFEKEALKYDGKYVDEENMVLFL